jgi:hypothetical protein
MNEEIGGEDAVPDVAAGDAAAWAVRAKWKSRHG